MKQPSKAKLLDLINDAFIVIAEQEKNKQYGTYLRTINRELIKNIDTLDSAKSYSRDIGARVILSGL